jgi:hypothetical protein
VTPHDHPRAALPSRRPAVSTDPHLPLAFVEATVDSLLDMHARIAGDVVEVDPTTSAIHGAIPVVDGDLILAELHPREDAYLTLHELEEGERGEPDR